jgi:hypothetical protein
VYRRAWITVPFLAAALVVVSDGSLDRDPPEVVAADVKQVGESALVQVRLKPGAEQRLGIEFAELREVPGRGTAVPYAAVVYDANGDTWVYTNPRDRTYIRAPITITTIDGEEAFLSEGPTIGTAVVTVRTAELYGVEQGIGRTRRNPHAS